MLLACEFIKPDKTYWTLILARSIKVNPTLKVGV